MSVSKDNQHPTAITQVDGLIIICLLLPPCQLYWGVWVYQHFWAWIKYKRILNLWFY